MEKTNAFPCFKENDGSITEYTVVKVIGKGGFGTCVEVQRKDGMHFACKIIDISNMLADISEFKILKKVQHTNVVTFLNVYSTGKQLHAFHELCACSLADILVDKMPVNQIKFVGYQILCGLRYIHQMLVIHRDVKPENVLIDMNGVIKLCDFGLAYDIEKPPPNASIDEDCGTPGYIPPEIYKGENWCFSSDVWALGVVILDMALGIGRIKRRQKVPPEIDGINSYMSIENPVYRPSAQKCLTHGFFRDAVFVNVLKD